MSAPAIDMTPVEEKKGPRLTKWVAKKWKPEYEKMVAYSVLGWSNKKIALELGYTKEHVSNVLNLPQAEELKDKLAAKMREKTLSIPETLQYVAEKTADRLRKLVDNDEVFEKHPFAVIDRGMDVLKGLSHLKGGGNGGNTTNVNGPVFMVPANNAQNLFDGMAKADEALRLNPANEVKAPSE
jgi:hypothetical protein